MNGLERVTELELVPVVEVRAWAFSDRELPQGPSRDHREEWARYWVDCLADAGVFGLSPVEPGSMHVATRAFSNPITLGRVLRRLVEAGDLSDPEAAGPLYGGFAMLSNGAVLSEPSCCGDLGDWTDWRAVANYRDPAWTMIWIGHPWLSARAEGDDLILSGPHESDTPEPRWIIERNLIAPAVDAALVELESFAGCIANALLDAAGNGTHTVAIARALAGLPT